MDRMRVQWGQLSLNGSTLMFDEFRQLPKKKRNALLQEVRDEVHRRKVQSKPEQPRRS